MGELLINLGKSPKISRIFKRNMGELTRFPKNISKIPEEKRDFPKEIDCFPGNSYKYFSQIHEKQSEKPEENLKETRKIIKKM